MRLLPGLIAALFCLAGVTGASPARSASASPPAASAPVVKSAHPTARVFAKHGVKLLRTQVVDRYPSFDVVFDYDPQTGPNQHKLNLLCADLLEANGWSPLKLVAREDGIEIRVKGDRRTRQVDIETSPID